MSTLAAPIALAAAAGYAVATVLQHRAARAHPVETTSTLQLQLRLVRSRSWWVSKGVDVAAVGLQAVALTIGSFVMVQAILTTGIVGAVALEARLARRRLSPRERWGSIGVAVGSLALVASGRGESDHHPEGRVLVLIAIAASLAIVLTVTHRACAAQRDRAMVLAISAAAAFSMEAAGMKIAAHALGDDAVVRAVVAVVAVVALAVLGNVWIHRSFQLGRFVPALASLVSAEPVLAVLLGSAVFADHVGRGRAGIAGGGTGLLLLAGSAAVLTLSVDPATSPDTVASRSGARS